jgi:hypothetical protein
VDADVRERRDRMNAHEWLDDAWVWALRITCVGLRQRHAAHGDRYRMMARIAGFKVRPTIVLIVMH